jgi:gamma-glutamyltranspeptidase/glutathione hydrolase/leukotriene-C4 hydrolase
VNAIHSSQKNQKMAAQIDEEKQTFIDLGKEEDNILFDVVKQKRTRMLGSFFIVGMIVATALCLSFFVIWAAEESDSDSPDHNGLLKVPTAAISTESEECSIIGKTIMQEKGGNAVDAAIAGCLCVGVLHNFASGIGGGGVLLIRTADGKSVMLDFREVAPSGATADMFVGKPGLSTVGGMAVAVPGELAGLEFAWRHYGSGNVTWSDIVTPSAELALEFVVDYLLALRIQSNLATILKDPGLSSVYAPKGVALQAGETASNPKLSETLYTVASEGAQAFYNPNSTLAQKLVKDIQDQGGIITLNDLSNYYYNNTVKARDPVTSFYQGYQVLSASPPFGGLCVLLSLNILELYNLPLMGKIPQSAQYLAEALNFAFADRMALGDPAFVNLSQVVPAMLSKEHASILRRRIKMDTTFPWQYYEDLVNFTVPVEDSGTTHLSVIDAQRNAASLTSTINLSFGAKFLSTSTGVILNNEMDDFSTPNTSNAFDLPASVANFVAPGKRPLSSMSPTVVTKDGQVYLVVGASGGSRIITATLQVLLNVVAYNQNVWEAVSSPRLHNQLLPHEIYTDQGFPQATIDFLKQVGHEMAFMEEIGVAAAVQQGDDGFLYAASDPRKLGFPAGF